jgi:hypothetical protein
VHPDVALALDGEITLHKSQIFRSEIDAVPEQASSLVLLQSIQASLITLPPSAVTRFQERKRNHYSLSTTLVFNLAEALL